MNPLYEQFNQTTGNNIMAQFNAFRQSFNGNPQQMIQSMLNSGKITQAQLNSAMQKANQMAKMFGIK
jgi:hypothetical protein